MEVIQQNGITSMGFVEKLEKLPPILLPSSDAPDVSPRHFTAVNKHPFHRVDMSYDIPKATWQFFSGPDKANRNILRTRVCTMGYQTSGVPTPKLAVSSINRWGE